METNRTQNFQSSSFLAAGEAPIVFTLGSTAVSHPGNFYQASRDATLGSASGLC